MRAAPLTTVKDGINRLRLKGGARADTLYDLLNGYVTEARTVKVRPGTRRIAQLQIGIRGLVAFDGSLHVFAHEAVFVPPGFTLHILIHPDATPDEPIILRDILFAKPFMGALYVVAEFNDESVYHYWLQVGETWENVHHYRAGALVVPTEPNGLVYRASRLGDPYPAWAPDVPRYDGTQSNYTQSIIEPTVYNDFYYAAVETIGNPARSGTVEPTWPTEDGAQIIEEAEGTGFETPGAPVPPSSGPTSGQTDRYGSFTRDSLRGGLVNIP